MNNQLDKISKDVVYSSQLYTIKWDISTNWPCIIIADYDLPHEVAKENQYNLTVANYVCVRYFCKPLKYALYLLLLLLFSSVIHSKYLLPFTMKESYKQLKKSSNDDIYDAYNAAYVYLYYYCIYIN